MPLNIIIDMLCGVRVAIKIEAFLVWIHCLRPLVPFPYLNIERLAHGYAVCVIWGFKSPFVMPMKGAVIGTTFQDEKLSALMTGGHVSATRHN
jgi:hypothetical protein